MVPNVAPWNLPVFLLFGVWDTVLVAMGLAKSQTLLLVLPWAWFETVISCAIANLAYRWFDRRRAVAQVA
jgi:hypothetical protein